MATEDDYLLLRFLRLHDSPCPECGYNLRNHSTGRCPECGFEVVLGVRHRRPSRRVAYDVLLIALALPAGLGLLEIPFVIVSAMRGLGTLRVWTSIVTLYPILCVVGTVGAFGLRRPLAQSRHVVRVLAWLFGAVDVGLILLRILEVPRLIGRP